MAHTDTNNNISSILESLLEIDDRFNQAYRQKNVKTLDSLVSPYWTGFLPDGRIIQKPELLKSLQERPSAFLIYERHAWQVVGHTGIVRGVMHASGNGQYSQNYLRIYAHSSSIKDMHNNVEQVASQPWQNICMQLLS